MENAQQPAQQQQVSSQALNRFHIEFSDTKLSLYEANERLASVGQQLHAAQARIEELERKYEPKPVASDQANPTPITKAKNS